MSLTAQFVIHPQAHGSNFDGGLLREDMVISKDSNPWKISRTIEIPPGRTLKIDPGVVLDANGLRTLFWVQGRLEISGTYQEPITIIGSPEQYLIDDEAERAEIIIRHLLVNGEGRGGFIPQNGRYGQSEVSIEDSEFINLPDMWATDSVWPLTIKRSIFKNSQGFSLAQRNETTTFINNVFIGEPLDYYGQSSWLDFWGIGEGGNFVIRGNDFSKSSGIIAIAKVDVDLSSNYWGKTELSSIQDRILDSGDSLKFPGRVLLDSTLSSRPIETPSEQRIIEFSQKSNESKSKPKIPLKYKNCRILNQEFPNGIARSTKVIQRNSIKSENPYVSASGYKQNKKLDRNSNGVACEKGERR